MQAPGDPAWWKMAKMPWPESLLHHLRAAVQPTLEDEQDQERQYILHVILLGLGITGFTYGMVSLILWLMDKSPLVPALVGLGLQPFYALAYVLGLRGRLRIATLIPPSTLLLAMILATAWVGIGHATMIGLAMTVTTASVLLGVRWALIFAALGSLSYWIEGLLQGTLGLPQVLPLEENIHLEVIGLAIGLASLVALNWLAAREIARGMQRRREAESMRRIVSMQSAELDRIRERLVRREKLALLGQMAGSVGHELRNPLSVISNAAYYLTGVLAVEDPGMREYLELIASEVKRATDIVNELLEFGRIKEPERASTSIAALIDSVVQHYPPPEGVDLILGPPKEDLLVPLDPVQMLQALGNLLANAYDAVIERREDVGREIYQGRVVLRVTSRDGAVEITVEDNGSGISAEIRERLFEPLVTTKARGIGLGLALVKMVVESHGGEIRAQSQEGTGSSFTIRLPMEEAKP